MDEIKDEVMDEIKDEVMDAESPPERGRHLEFLPGTSGSSRCEPSHVLPGALIRLDVVELLNLIRPVRQPYLAKTLHGEEPIARGSLSRPMEVE